MKTIVPNWNVPPHIQAFTTTREGGVSLPPFDSFNLGDHVEDDKSAVKTNRTLLVEKFNLIACRFYSPINKALKWLPPMLAGADSVMVY